MQKNEVCFTQDIYSEHLATINGITFTPREIDVIACLLSARGTSKIASFLSIAPRTIATHIRNIMLKLERNSRENILDFIEKTSKDLCIRCFCYKNRMEPKAYVLK
ncbi:MAG: helix-turn-helix transcriptional regulator [Alphaproteobacteria bacterium]|nr:helix-turn-helix transcriptional regulator [Alphaproteobacteria bacterium]